MFKKKSTVNQAMLREELLPEGGGLTADALEALNQETSINASVAGGLLKSQKSRGGSDETRIEGLKEFNKYGDLFQDLTKREHVDTF